LNIGSITKTFTSAIVLQLVQEGAITLEDSIGRWVGPYANVDGAITVRQLLGHTGGVANYSEHPQFWPFMSRNLYRMMEPEEVFQFVGPPDFAPGTSWTYSNTGYLLLGMLVERVTGRSYEEELARRIVGPFGLSSIAMGNTDSLPGTVVTSWGDIDGDGDLDRLDQPPLRAHFSSTWTSGGLFSRIEDLGRWGDMLYRGRVLSPAMMTELTTFRNVSGLGPNGGYGLGVMRANPDGRPGMGHGGSMPGFHSHLWHVPGDSVTVAIIVNQDSPAAMAIALQLLNEYRLREAQISSASATTLATTSTLAPRPNPFTDITHIELSAARSGTGTVRIYSLLGTPVRTLVDGTITDGTHALMWDGDDDAGAELPSGTYLVRMQTGEETVTGRVAKR
jgi:D-alanyl-D-alanine carboxypeptidase